MCEDFMSNVVDCDNCLKLRAFANRYNLSKLRERTDRVVVTQFADVTRSDDFMFLDIEDVLSIMKSKRRKVISK